MDKKLITVIIPIYNAEEYLERCLKSVINQTYSNIEIILIDDGSQDNCPNICDKYAKIDERIKVIHKKNSGVSAARNDGLKIAKGEYVTFIDSDDYVDKKYIEILYKDCLKNNAEVSIIGTNAISETGKTTGDYSIEKKKIYNSEGSIKQLLLGKYYKSAVWGKMYKLDLFKDIRFNVNTKIGEDLEILCKILSECKTINVNTKERLYYYIIRDNSVSHNAEKEIRDEELAVSENIIKEICIKYPKLKKYAIGRYIEVNITQIVEIIGNDRISEEEKCIEIEKLKENINKYKKYKHLQNYKVKIKLLLIYSDVNLLKKLLEKMRRI